MVHHFRASCFQNCRRKKAFILRDSPNGQAENYQKYWPDCKDGACLGKSLGGRVKCILIQLPSNAQTSIKRSQYELLMKRCVRNKVPVIICNKSIPDAFLMIWGKTKMKRYADELRSTTSQNIRSGDVVLERQRRRNKFSAPFKLTPTS